MIVQVDVTDSRGERWSFTWDSEAGTFTGIDGERFARWAEELQAAGYVTGHPYPTTYRLVDPFRDPADLAKILAAGGYRLPVELAPHFQEPEDTGEAEEIH